MVRAGVSAPAGSSRRTLLRAGRARQRAVCRQRQVDGLAGDLPARSSCIARHRHRGTPTILTRSSVLPSSV